MFKEKCELLQKNCFEEWFLHQEIPTASHKSKELPLFVPTPTFGKPVWNGDKVVLLVNADCGLGDTIQFVRFCSQAAQKVEKLILRCDSDLHFLFQPLGFDLVSKDEELPDFDEIIHLLALPGVLKIKKVEGKAYLKTNPCPKDSFLELVNVMSFTKMGVCWAGNQFNPRDSQRSIPKELLSILKFKEGMTFFSLQKQYDPPDWFLDCRNLMNDWNSTAQLIGELELVITVDTAVAHLAGALGCRQVWLLLPTNPDWRWGFDRKTPWYDNMIIFRQRNDGDWRGVLQEAADLLATL